MEGCLIQIRLPSGSAMPRPWQGNVPLPLPVLWKCCAQQPSGDNGDKAAPSLPSPSPSTERKRARVAAETTDWIASSLTRRFGLGAGLAWVGFLAIGVVSEQIKTRREVYLEEQGTRDVEEEGGREETVLEDKVRFREMRVGGGSRPGVGELVVVDVVGRVAGGAAPFVDTVAQKRPIAFVFGRRPLAGAICEGLEEALATMRVGGKRKVVVPPALGFGPSGKALLDDAGGSVIIPPDATLEYIVQLRRISIAPS